MKERKREEGEDRERLRLYPIESNRGENRYSYREIKILKISLIFLVNWNIIRLDEHKLIELGAFI